jgi:hypothetical protein
MQPTYEELPCFFSEAPDLLCIDGFDGKLKGLNPACQPALESTLQVLLPRPLLDFVHPEPPDHAIPRVGKPRDPEL